MCGALGMLSHCSLPLPRKQRIEKSIETGDVMLDPLDPTYSLDPMKVTYIIMNIVAKFLPPDSIKQTKKRNEHAFIGIPSRREPIGTYPERLLHLAQTYLNLIISNRVSTESTNLAMILLSTARFLRKTIPSIMESHVSATKTKLRQENEVFPSVKVELLRSSNCF